MTYKRFAGESEKAYIYRICSMKESIGTWDDVAKILNAELEHDYTSSAYRKPFQDYNTVHTVREPEIINNQALLEEIRQERRELEKEKVKFRDERNAYNRQVTKLARYENLFDLLEKEVKAIDNFTEITNVPVIVNGDEEMIVMLSDLHIGVGADNSWNYFDNNVLNKRLGEYIAHIKMIAQRHNIHRMHFVLGGDIISGAIHLTLRIENRENVIKQIITAATTLSDFFSELALQIENVDMHIYSVAGNHSRLTANKKEHLKGENLDELIPFYMQARLQNFKNIEFHANTIDESIGSFYVKNKLVYFVHGDKDNVSNVVQKLTMMTGKKPDIVLMGHRHTNALTTVYDTKVIECGTLSGTDSYCVDNRLANRPEQCIAVCSDNGLECLYDIKF